MTGLLRRHLRRLYRLHAAACLAVAAAALLARLAHPKGPPPIAQADAILGVLVGLATLNLVTLLPVRRAMIASPRRVFALSADAGPLLKAHLRAQAIALARAVALAAAALAALFLTGRQEWFWILESSAALALAMLWPARRATASLLGESPPSRPQRGEVAPRARL